MKGPGLFSMLQIAAGLSMAGPMYVIGFEFARTGQVLPGIGFFVLGILVMFFPTYLVRRIGGPRAWVKRRLAKRRSLNAPDGDGEGSSSSLFRNRFRRNASSDDTSNRNDGDGERMEGEGTGGDRTGGT